MTTVHVGLEGVVNRILLAERIYLLLLGILMHINSAEMHQPLSAGDSAMHQEWAAVYCRPAADRRSMRSAVSGWVDR